MSPADALPRCPRCGGTQSRKIEDKLYYCSACGTEHDGIDDGIVGYGDPARFAERRERWQQRQQQRQRKTRR